MRRDELVLLDPHALRARLDALDLKQWWLAHTLGVHPRTVSRWLKGATTRIARHNVEQLAEVLGCAVDDLLATEGPVHATATEQRAAARLLQERNLLLLLSPGDEWALAERLIHAVLEPDLPLADLGRLYNLLSVTAWRQGHYDIASGHATRAADIGERLDDLPIRFKARLNLATIASLVGDPQEALALYRWCATIDDPRIPAPDRAAATFNLGTVLADCCEYAEALAVERAAIAQYQALGFDFNLAIAWLGIGVISIEQGDFATASEALDRVSKHSLASGFRKGEAHAATYRGDIASLTGDLTEARHLIPPALATLRSLDPYDLACDQVEARLERLAGKWGAFETVIKESFERADRFPLAQAGLHIELARAALAQGDSAGEVRHREEANRLYQSLGLTKRLRTIPVVEHGQMFVAPSTSRRKVRT